MPLIPLYYGVYRILPLRCAAPKIGVKHRNKHQMNTKHQPRRGRFLTLSAGLFCDLLPMQMLGADLKAHKVNYQNNPILKWCLTNTGIQTDRNGDIVPIKNQSPRQRIDGTAALLDCYVGLYEHYNEFTGAI